MMWQVISIETEPGRIQ